MASAIAEGEESPVWYLKRERPLTTVVTFCVRFSLARMSLIANRGNLHAACRMSEEAKASPLTLKDLRCSMSQLMRICVAIPEKFLCLRHSS